MKDKTGKNMKLEQVEIQQPNTTAILTTICNGDKDNQHITVNKSNQQQHQHKNNNKQQPPRDNDNKHRH